MQNPDVKKKEIMALSVSERILFSNQLKAKYPDKIPIIVSVATNRNFENRTGGEMDLVLTKNKYLGHRDAPLGALMMAVRTHCHPTLHASEALFVFTKSRELPKLTLLCSELKPDIDGFVHLEITKENTFGSLFIK